MANIGKLDVYVHRVFRARVGARLGASLRLTEDPESPIVAKVQITREQWDQLREVELPYKVSLALELPAVEHKNLPDTYPCVICKSPIPTMKYMLLGVCSVSCAAERDALEQAGWRFNESVGQYEEVDG